MASEVCPNCNHVVEPKAVFKPSAKDSPAGEHLQCPHCGHLLRELESAVKDALAKVGKVV